MAILKKYAKVLKNLLRLLKKGRYLPTKTNSLKNSVLFHWMVIGFEAILENFLPSHPIVLV